MILRVVHPDDAAELLSIYAPYVLHTPISFLSDVPSVEELSHTITSYSSTHPWLVAEEEQEGRRSILGYAYATKLRERAAYRWSAESSVYIAQHHHRRGIGRVLYAALFELLRLQGFHSLYAGITLPNAASEGLHRSCGFEPVGVYRKVGYKLGAWHDVGWFQRALGDYPDNPKEPIAFTNLSPSAIQDILRGEMNYER